MEEEIEVWKVVEGFSRYEVSSKGKVREVESLREIPQPINGGFFCVNLYGDDDRKVLAKVHRLVAIAFIPNTEGVKMVEHKRHRLINDVSNLQWKPKAVKEVVEKRVETLTFLNKTYTYPEFCIAVGCELRILKGRIGLGWSVRECFTGIKKFKGEGYENENHWFPTKGALEEANTLKRIEQARKDKLQRNKENAIKRAERKAKVHYGFGVFTNYPIKGIEGRKPLQVYSVWQGIIARCYNPNHDSYKRYGERGCTVSLDWKDFQDFAIWYEEQQSRGMGNAHISWHVDKDILFDGNLEYGPATCCFVPDDVNIFFAALSSDVRGYSFYKGKWVAAISISGVKHQRCFDNEQAASNWYSKGKTKAAEFLVWKYEGLLDKRVIDRLSKI